VRYASTSIDAVVTMVTLGELAMLGTIIVCWVFRLMHLP
jgi:hypothetical protein